MKALLKITGLLIIGIVIICGSSFLLDNTHYSTWKIISTTNNKKAINWAKFEWTSQELNGVYFDKLSMNIPCKISGLPNHFTFQFDLGASTTGVYETSFSSFYANNPAYLHRIKSLKSKIQFWNKNKYFEDLTIRFGNYTASNKIGYVYKNFGEAFPYLNPNDTIHLGTIGADLFKDKILLIDYPHQQFAICDVVPPNYTANLIDIELDQKGRAVLPMKIHGNSYRILFDNGSSIFPIITSAKHISNYSNSPDIDTIQISSWGKMHAVTGKLINDSFQLAGKYFNHIKVYSNHTGLGIDTATDGMAGNALFWNNTLLIDFKHKKFGVF